MFSTNFKMPSDETFVSGTDFSLPCSENDYRKNSIKQHLINSNCISTHRIESTVLAERRCTLAQGWEVMGCHAWSKHNVFGQTLWNTECKHLSFDWSYCIISNFLLTVLPAILSLFGRDECEAPWSAGQISRFSRAKVAFFLYEFSEIKKLAETRTKNLAV